MAEFDRAAAQKLADMTLLQYEVETDGVRVNASVPTLLQMQLQACLAEIDRLGERTEILSMEAKTLSKVAEKAFSGGYRRGLEEAAKVRDAAQRLVDRLYVVH